MKSVVVHEEVPKEEAAVKTLKSTEEAAWKPASGHRAPLKGKKWTQGNGGSQKFATTSRGMTRHAIPALCKGCCCQGQGKDRAVPRTQKTWTFGKTCWVKPEGISGRRNQGLKEQLCLRKERTSGKIFGKTMELGIMN
jgi:hypothetical protein